MSVEIKVDVYRIWSHQSFRLTNSFTGPPLLKLLNFMRSSSHILDIKISPEPQNLLHDPNQLKNLVWKRNENHEQRVVEDTFRMIWRVRIKIMRCGVRRKWQRSRSSSETEEFWDYHDLWKGFWIWKIRFNGKRYKRKRKEYINRYLYSRKSHVQFCKIELWCNTFFLREYVDTLLTYLK